MATVYLCVDTKFDRKVAIKLLHPDLAAAVGADRFHREIKIATGLTHPNILPAHDSGEAEGSLYYVMPFVDGESLRDRLTRERQLPVQDAVRITCEIASALQYAHTRGIVHRDIKPENILLESDHAVLADFGIARAVTSAADTEALTQTGMSLGTPSYMSPEQAMGERHIDGRSDQYSLACVMYEMLAGYPPFMATTMQALVAKHLGEPVPLLTTVRPAVPDELEDVVLRALEKVPADRFATMQEFSDALSGVIATTGTWARRTTGVRMPAMRQTRSQRAQAQRAKAQGRQFAIAAGLMLVLLGAGAGAWRWKLSARHLLTDADSKHVGVLYFDDQSNAGQLRYLADGLTESLIDQLSQISALDVVSRNGVLPYRGKSIAPDSVARALKTGTLVVGTVEPAAKGARINVRLLDGYGVLLEGRSFEYDTSRALTMQDSLATDVAAFLRKHLGDEVRLREQKRATKSSDAWLMVQRAERRNKDADSLLEASAAPQALVALAESDSLLVRAEAADRNWSTPPALRAAVAYSRAVALRKDPAQMATVVDSGIAYADHAIALDPRNADALEYKGKLLYFFRVGEHLIVNQREADRTLTLAESTLTRAVTVNRNQAGAWEALSSLYYRKPDLALVVDAAEKAYKADEYMRSTRSILQRLFQARYNLEQFPEAMRTLDDYKRRFPSDKFYLDGRLLMYGTRYAKPDIDSAWTFAEQYVRQIPGQDSAFTRRRMDMYVAGAIARAGLADSARRVLVRARAKAGSDIDPKHDLSAIEAIVRVRLGDQDEAVRLLKDYLTVNPEHRKGFASRTMWWWRDLQSNPKFKSLIAVGQ
jgi:serine/threonine-protein kinase